MRHRRGGGFVDQPPGPEPVERERRGERMRLAARDRMGEHVARARRRLEVRRCPSRN